MEEEASFVLELSPNRFFAFFHVILPLSSFYVLT